MKWRHYLEAGETVAIFCGTGLKHLKQFRDVQGLVLDRIVDMESCPKRDPVGGDIGIQLSSPY